MVVGDLYFLYLRKFGRHLDNKEFISRFVSCRWQIIRPYVVEYWQMNR